MDYYNYGASLNPAPNPWQVGLQQVPQMIQPIQASEDKLVWVRGGEKAVASYPQAPGRTGYYTDFDEPILVKKVTNNNGQIAELKVFDLVERVSQPVNNSASEPSSFVTEQAFNQFQLDISSALDRITDSINELKKPTYNKYQNRKEKPNG